MTSTGSLLHRLTPFITNRIRQNQRLLSSSALQQPPPSPSPSHETVRMTDSCIRRLKELHLKEAEGKMLRLSVETGGCSGFQYVFLLDDKTNSDDRVFEKEGVKLVVDKISHDFVKGATVDYVEELIRSAFVVTENPSAVGGCSCKSSFMNVRFDKALFTAQSTTMSSLYKHPRRTDTVHEQQRDNKPAEEKEADPFGLDLFLAELKKTDPFGLDLFMAELKCRN